MNEVVQFRTVPREAESGYYESSMLSRVLMAYNSHQKVGETCTCIIEARRGAITTTYGLPSSSNHHLRIHHLDDPSTGIAQMVYSHRADALCVSIPLICSTTGIIPS
jgi:hypothetical protein